jgi:hypothetical protein
MRKHEDLDPTMSLLCRLPGRKLDNFSRVFLKPQGNDTTAFRHSAASVLLIAASCRWSVERLGMSRPNGLILIGFVKQ